MNEPTTTLPEMVHCEHAGCIAEFFLVPSRGVYARLCIDHTHEARRQVEPWSPEISVD